MPDFIRQWAQNVLPIIRISKIHLVYPDHTLADIFSRYLLGHPCQAHQLQQGQVGTDPG